MRETGSVKKVAQNCEPLRTPVADMTVEQEVETSNLILDPLASTAITDTNLIRQGTTLQKQKETI